MTRNRITAAAALCCASMLVAACGGGSAAVGTASGAPTTAGSSNARGNGTDGTGGAGGARGFPGATGLLAQIDGTTLQVQGTDAQTAVTYSAKTTFTNTVAAKRSDVVVGVCVQARSARTAPGGTSGTSGTSGTATTAPSPATSPMVAASVEISPAVSGSCRAMGGARMGGTLPRGAAGEPTPPAGMPTSGRTRGPGAGGGFGLGAFGKVTAVNGAGFTVESSPPVNGTTTATAPATRTVQTPASTSYTRTGTVDAKALAVGLCVTAMGKADDTGSIAATSIMLRPAENGSCSSGFGGRGPGGMPTPGGGTGA